MESGWDPEVKIFFTKILNSISYSLLWMIACATAGIYFKLGYTSGQPIANPIIFYSLAVITFFLLVRHLYKMWK
jgi:hypothetical protein